MCACMRACVCVISMYSSMCGKYSSNPPNRATNIKSMEALTQVLQKSSRLEYFADSGMNASPRDVRCGNCGGGGHYHLTCSKKCKICRSTPYCDHLGLCSVYTSICHVP